jgi:NAD(P)-dependent dehydrogenase (short-subunit alcohol dehydrogenase family)
MRIEGSVALVTGADRVKQVASECADVDLVVNNAGVMKASTFIGAPSLDAARLEMETNYYTNPLDASYGASKAAALSLTNGIRIELAPQRTLVVAVQASFIDTDMSKGLDVPKDSPESVAGQALDAVEAGQVEVLADARTRFVKESLSRDHELIYPDVEKFWLSLVKGGK